MEHELTKTSTSTTPDKKALGLAYPDTITPDIKELLAWVESQTDEEFVKSMRPVVLMGMIQLHGIAEDDNLEVAATKVSSFALNVDGKPDRMHQLITLPSPCQYKLCTGCNFVGKGRQATIADIDRAMSIAVSDNEQYLGENDNLVLLDITSGGSIFNPLEVPDDVRRYLWKKIAEYGREQKAKGRHVAFITETRVDDLSEILIKEMFTYFKDAVDEVEIGWGVERMDKVGREVMWHKMMPPDWEKTVRLFKDPAINQGIETINVAHVMLTVPGETDAEGVEYASQSIKELLDNQLCDKVVLMATNRKAATVPGFIKSDLPSIFTLAETIKKVRTLGEEAGEPDRYLKRVLVRGFAGIAKPDEVEYIKAGCEKCEPIEALLKDWHPENYDELIALMERVDCPDKNDWDTGMSAVQQFTRKQRIALIWDYLARRFWKKSLMNAAEVFGDINFPN